jgi:drug/metabolite transporter (DMT)-like permease
MATLPKLNDWLALLTLVVFWGSSFALTKTAVSTIAPEWVVAGRLCAAALILLASCVLTGRRIPWGNKLWAWYVWLAFVGNVVPFYLITWGTLHIASGVAGILMAFVPLSIIVLAHFVLPDEKLNRHKVLGFSIGFVGVIALFGVDKITNFSGQGLAFWGQIAVIGATVCYAVHSISARLMPKTGPVEMSAAVMLLASAGSVITALITAPSGLANADLLSGSSILVLGIFPTALASILLYHMLATAGPSFVSYCNYLIPAFAIIVGVVIMGEEISTSALLGLVFIMSGIAISRRRQGQNRTPTLKRGA